MPELPNATGGSGSESVSQLRAASYVTPCVCVRPALSLLSGTEQEGARCHALGFFSLALLPRFTLTADLFFFFLVGGPGGKLVGE